MQSPLCAPLLIQLLCVSLSMDVSMAKADDDMLDLHILFLSGEGLAGSLKSYQLLLTVDGFLVYNL